MATSKELLILLSSRPIGADPSGMEIPTGITLTEI